MMRLIMDYLISSVPAISPPNRAAESRRGIRLSGRPADGWRSEGWDGSPEIFLSSDEPPIIHEDDLSSFQSKMGGLHRLHSTERRSDLNFQRESLSGRAANSPQMKLALAHGISSRCPADRAGCSLFVTCWGLRSTGFVFYAHLCRGGACLYTMRR